MGVFAIDQPYVLWKSARHWPCVTLLTKVIKRVNTVSCLMAELITLTRLRNLVDANVIRHATLVADQGAF